jgi:pimeloyl-ACP methyl ester carboxylesterase
MQPTFLECSDGRRIAYHLSEGQSPCVLFLGGFKSNMYGGKAEILEAYCCRRGQRFIRFDYTGHGQSSGAFADGTIGGWKQDALTVFDRLGSSQNILVGSSMGAWIALLVALERKERVSGLVTIAAAADFTERCIWQRLPQKERSELMEKGIYLAPSCYGEEPYPITRQLIEEARTHLLLGKDIPLTMPVRLLHGMQDEDVPWTISQEIMNRLATRDADLLLIKDGGHRLSEPDQLHKICKALESILP